MGENLVAQTPIVIDAFFQAHVVPRDGNLPRDGLQQLEVLARIRLVGLLVAEHEEAQPGGAPSRSSARSIAHPPPRATRDRRAATRAGSASGSSMMLLARSASCSSGRPARVRRRGCSRPTNTTASESACRPRGTRRRGTAGGKRASSSWLTSFETLEADSSFSTLSINSTRIRCRSYASRKKRRSSHRVSCGLKRRLRIAAPIRYR